MKTLVFKWLNIRTNAPLTFEKELGKLCNRFAEKRDYDWEVEMVE